MAELCVIKTSYGAVALMCQPALVGSQRLKVLNCSVGSPTHLSDQLKRAPALQGMNYRCPQVQELACPGRPHRFDIVHPGNGEGVHSSTYHHQLGAGILVERKGPAPKSAISSRTAGPNSTPLLTIQWARIAKTNTKPPQQIEKRETAQLTLKLRYGPFFTFNSPIINQ